MPIARLFVLKAHPEAASALEETVDELHRWLSQQPGFIVGWNLRSQARPGELVRMTVWESEADADRAVNHDRCLALRSQVLLHASEIATAGGSYEAEGTRPNPKRAGREKGEAKR